MVRHPAALVPAVLAVLAVASPHVALAAEGLCSGESNARARIEGSPRRTASSRSIGAPASAAKMQRAALVEAIRLGVSLNQVVINAEDLAWALRKVHQEPRALDWPRLKIDQSDIEGTFALWAASGDAPAGGIGQDTPALPGPRRVYDIQTEISHSRLRAPDIKSDDGRVMYTDAAVEVAGVTLLKPLRIVDSIVSGNINLTGAVLAVGKEFQDRYPRSTPFSMSIRTTMVDGSISMRSTVASAPVVMYSSELLGQLEVTKTQFRKSFWAAGSVFCGGARVSETTFEDDAVFQRTFFGGDVQSISATIFRKPVSFRDAEVQSDLVFESVVFEDSADFTRVSTNATLVFAGVDFRKGADFLEISGGTPVTAKPQYAAQGHLAFAGVTFGGPADFSGTSVNSLRFVLDSQGQRGADPQARNYSIQSLMEGRWGEASRRSRFLGTATFSKVACVDCVFSRAEFGGRVDFSEARFGRTYDISDVVFEKEARFSRAAFPAVRADAALQAPSAGTFFNDARFFGPTYLRWDQVGPGMHAHSAQTWRTLEEVFRQSGDIKGQLEAQFQREDIQAREASSPIDSGTAAVDRFVWGYGYRPWRPAQFAIALFLSALGLYFFFAWRELNPKSVADYSRTAKAAIKFTYKASVYPFYAWDNVHGRWLIAVSIAYSITFKILMALFLYSFSLRYPVVQRVVQGLV
jgi:hypothetical protein